MGLLPANGGGKTTPRTTVNVGEHEYTLRRFISGYEKRELDSAGLVMVMSQEEINNLDEAMFSAKPNVAARELMMLEKYLIEWSHSEPLTRANIKRLPPVDWDALVKAINELQKEQAQPSEALGESSGT